MTMTDITDLLPEVMTFAPAAPEPLMLRHLRDAARMLCTRLKCWRDEQTIIITDPAQPTAAIADAEIVSIEAARLDGQRLTPKSIPWLDEIIWGWRDETEDCGSARYITQMTPNTVRIVPPATGSLIIGLVLQPSRKAQQIPDFLLAQFGSELGKGAAGRVLLTPKADFANPALGGTLWNEFTGYLDHQQPKAARTQLGAAVRTRARFF